MNLQGIFLALASLVLFASTQASNPKLTSPADGVNPGEVEVMTWKMSAALKESPENHHMRLTTAFLTGGKVKVAVSDFTGKFLYVRIEEVDEGQYLLDIPIKGLAKGSYEVVVKKYGEKDPIRKTFAKF